MFVPHLITWRDRLPVQAIVPFFFLSGIGFIAIWGTTLLLLSGTSFSDLRHPDRIPADIQTAYVVGLYLFLIGSIVFWGRRSENWRDWGLSFQGKHVFAGLAMGSAMLIIQYALQILFGWMTWQSPDPSKLLGAIAIGLIAASLFAIVEECLFRGLILHNFLVFLPRWGAIALSSYLYAQLHFLRFDLAIKDMLIPLAGLSLAGCLFCLVRLQFHSLWVPIGVHAAWIFLISSTTQLQTFAFQDGEWIGILTGRYYPVSGLIAIPLLLLAIASLSLFSKGKNGESPDEAFSIESEGLR